MKPTKSIYILLSLFLIFSCGDNSTEPEGCDGVSGSGLVLDECGVCDGDNSTCCINVYSEVDGSLISCGESCVELEGECYYQGDIDVLQDFIDVNESLSGEEPLEIGSKLWVDGRLDRLSLDHNQPITYYLFLMVLHHSNSHLHQ
jgi:hypothetical protein